MLVAAWRLAAWPYHLAHCWAVHWLGLVAVTGLVQHYLAGIDFDLDRLAVSLAVADSVGRLGAWGHLAGFVALLPPVTVSSNRCFL